MLIFIEGILLFGMRCHLIFKRFDVFALANSFTTRLMRQGGDVVAHIFICATEEKYTYRAVGGLMCCSATPQSGGVRFEPVTVWAW